jgi:hypothetical protein
MIIDRLFLYHVVPIILGEKPSLVPKSIPVCVTVRRSAITLIVFTFTPFEEVIAIIGFMPIEFFTNFAHMYM